MADKKVSIMRILLANLTKLVGDTGGLAKVTAAFANEMQRRGHEVSLVYSDVQTGDFYYPLDAGIRRMIYVIMKVKVILSLFGIRQNGRFCVPLISVKLVV